MDILDGKVDTDDEEFIENYKHYLYTPGTMYLPRYSLHIPFAYRLPTKYPGIPD